MRDNRTGSGWLLRTGALIGDLGNPFYAEERQRDVWNEASAVGLQLMLWLGLVAATAMVWIAGGPALPYSSTVMGVVGVSSLVTLAYAKRLGVVIERQRLVRARMVPYLILVAVYLLGLMRATGDTRSPSFWAGVVSGLAVVAGAHLLLVRRCRGERLDLD